VCGVHQIAPADFTLPAQDIAGIASRERRDDLFERNKAVPYSQLSAPPF
jgi:hypothetical protein